MRIKDILKVESDVVTIDADQTVHEGICKMNEHRIGALVVTDSSANNGMPIPPRATAISGTLGVEPPHRR